MRCLGIEVLNMQIYLGFYCTDTNPQIYNLTFFHNQHFFKQIERFFIYNKISHLQCHKLVTELVSLYGKFIAESNKKYNEIKVDWIDDIPSAWTGHRVFGTWLVRYLKPSVVVELGVDRGFSSFLFAQAVTQNKEVENKEGVVYGIDLFGYSNFW